MQIAGNILLLGTCLCLMLSSCKSTKKVTEKEKTNVDFKNAKVLSTLLKENEFKFDYLTAKFDCKTTIDSSNNSFKVNMRILRDSLIWMSISPALGIEVARIQIGRDSVKLLNRIEKTYFIGGYDYINKLLQSDLDYDALQSLLIGNSVDFYDEEEKLKASVYQGNYILGTIKKRKLKKAINKNKEYKAPIQSITLIPKTYKISQLLFKDFETNREFKAGYSNFIAVDSTLFPHNISFNISAQKQLAINIEYTKVAKATDPKFPFGIPDKYEQIFYNEQ